MELVSPVFFAAVSSEKRFLKFVRLSVKHSSKLGSVCLPMTFCRSSHCYIAAHPSLQIKPLDKEHFTNFNRASIALDSLLQVVAVTQHKHRAAHTTQPTPVCLTDHLYEIVLIIPDEV